jgi:small conductance mechanosensitive channel
VRTFVGNNKIFSDTIQNYTINPYRRVELTAQISGAAEPALANSRLKDRVSKIANVLDKPAADVTIVSFTPSARSWRSGLIATTTITGRFTSMRTWRFAKSWATARSPERRTRS